MKKKKRTVHRPEKRKLRNCALDTLKIKRGEKIIHSRAEKRYDRLMEKGN